MIFGDSSWPQTTVSTSGGKGVFIPIDSQATLPAVIDSVLVRDVEVPSADTPIRSTHRRIDGHDVYFIINDSDTPWQGPISLAVNGEGDQLDPATGSITRLTSGKNILLNLAPYGAMLFRFKQGV
jgi:hypothetical protein